jgi:hypothetical protein
MASSPDHRKNKRFEYKSIVMIESEHAEYFSYAKCIILAVVGCI